MYPKIKQHWHWLIFIVFTCYILISNITWLQIDQHAPKGNGIMPLKHGLDLLNAFKHNGFTGFLDVLEPFAYIRGPVPGLLFFFFYKFFGVNHDLDFLLQSVLFIIIFFVLFKYFLKSFGIASAFFSILLLGSIPGLLNFWHQGFVEFILFFFISLAGYHFLESNNFKVRKHTILFSVYSIIALWTKLEALFYYVGPLVLIIHSLVTSKKVISRHWKVNIVISMVVFSIGFSLFYFNPEALATYLPERMGHGGDLSIPLIFNKFEAFNLIVPLLECFGIIVFAILIASIILTSLLNLVAKNKIPMLRINSAFLLFIIPIIPYIFFAGHSSIYITSHIVVTIFFAINFITTLFFEFSKNKMHIIMTISLLPLFALSQILCFYSIPSLGKFNYIFEKPHLTTWNTTFQKIASSMLNNSNKTQQKKSYIFVGCYGVHASKFQLDYHLKMNSNYFYGDTLEIWGDPEAIMKHILPKISPKALIFDAKPDFVILWEPMHKISPRKDLAILKTFNFIQENLAAFNRAYDLIKRIKTPINSDIVVYKKSPYY